jgi:HlyD family secretion protein
VNYTVVVTLENPDGKLLPGMTARVDFLVKSATHILKVSNAALRYRPSAEVLAQFGAETMSKDATTTTGSNPATGAGGGAGGMRARKNQGSGAGNGFGMLYSLDTQGKLQVARVHTGISDGASTEVLDPNVTEGLKVIEGLASTTASTSQKEAAVPGNPMGGGQQNSGARGRGF